MTNENNTTIPESPSGLPQTPRNIKSSWVAGKRNRLLRRIPLFKSPKTETPMMAPTSSRPADYQHVATNSQHVEPEYSSTQHEEADRSVSPDSALVGVGHDGDRDRGEGSQSPPPPPSNSQYQYQSVASPPVNPKQSQAPNEADMGIYPAYPATFPGGFHSYSPPPMAMYPGSPIAPQVINFQGWGQAYDAQSLMSSRMLIAWPITFDAFLLLTSIFSSNPLHSIWTTSLWTRRIRTATLWTTTLPMPFGSWPKSRIFQLAWNHLVVPVYFLNSR